MQTTEPRRHKSSSALALKVPPLALAAFVAALMWVLPAWPLSLAVAPWLVAASAAVAGVGLAICLAGVQAFRQSKTTVDPRTPDAASSLVVGSIYRYTRNPMYLGFLMVLLALALYLGKASSFALLPLFVVYLNELQIKPEEHALRERFGFEFDAYAARVRRWL